MCAYIRTCVHVYVCVCVPVISVLGRQARHSPGVHWTASLTYQVSFRPLRDPFSENKGDGKFLKSDTWFFSGFHIYLHTCIPPSGNTHV